MRLRALKRESYAYLTVLCIAGLVALMVGAEVRSLRAAVDDRELQLAKFERLRGEVASLSLIESAAVQRHLQQIEVCFAEQTWYHNLPALRPVVQSTAAGLRIEMVRGEAR